MLIEHRTYQLKTSAIRDYFDVFGEVGVALQEKYMAPCVGHYVTEVGPHSQIIALWKHDTFEARLEGRRRLYGDAQWREIIQTVSPLIEHIDSKLLVPSPSWKSRV